MKDIATYPGSVWNGLSDNPNRTSLNDDIPPDTRDWDRLVAEVIATQTQLTAGGTDVLEAVVDSGNGAMTYAGVWSNSTTYEKGAVIHNRATDNRFYVALRTTVGDVPENNASDWYPLSQTAVGVPPASSATGSPHDFYILANSSGNVWFDLEAAMQSVIADNTALDNRYESYSLDPLVAGVKHGTPLRVYITVGAKGTGSSDDGNLTANTVLETAAFAGYIFTVNTSVSGNRTNPVTTYNAGDTTYTCTVPNTGNTTWNAIIASWNAAQSDVIIDHPVSGNYEAGVTTTGNSTILIGGDGVLVEQRVTTCNITANAKEATVFGLAWNGTNNGTTTPGNPVLVQTAGTMTFTAEQTVNTFNNATLTGSDLLVPGEAYYLDATLENEPVAANAYCVPIGVAISPTEFRLRLGLPVKAVVGA